MNRTKTLVSPHAVDYAQRRYQAGDSPNAIRAELERGGLGETQIRRVLYLALPSEFSRERIQRHTRGPRIKRVETFNSPFKIDPTFGSYSTPQVCGETTRRKRRRMLSYFDLLITFYVVTFLYFAIPGPVDNSRQSFSVIAHKIERWANQIIATNWKR